LRAPRSRSSSQSLRTWLASPYIDLFLALAEGGKGARPAHPLQAPGPLRPDAADRDIQLGVDLRVGVRRVAGGHRPPLLAAGRPPTCPTSTMSGLRSRYRVQMVYTRDA